MLTMKKFVHYIGFLTLTLFIGSSTLVNAETVVPTPLEPTTEAVQRTKEQIYPLLLQEIATCQAATIQLAKFFGVTYAVMQTIDPNDITLERLSSLSGTLANRLAKYQELEQSVARQLQADGLNPQELGAVANSKYNYIMQLGGQAYMGAHTADGVAIMQTWITALLDATGKWEVNISDYIDELIEVNK